MLQVCAEVNAQNPGANLDIGHAIAVRESLAEATTLLASRGRLFCVPTDDNTGEGDDWDMMSGTIHFWHWLELLYTLERVGYDAWLGADIIPKSKGSVAIFQTNFLIVQLLTALLRRVGMDELQTWSFRMATWPRRLTTSVRAWCPSQCVS